MLYEPLKFRIVRHFHLTDFVLLYRGLIEVFSNRLSKTKTKTHQLVFILENHAFFITKITIRIGGKNKVVHLCTYFCYTVVHS